MLIIGILLGISAVLALYVWRRLRHVFGLFRLPEFDDTLVDEATLPSVSLCIPARNEVHAMTDCLESALRSDYPKLEIIVLDDGSRDDTGHLIRSFAHSGIRFLEGSPLPDGWLGKNHALEELAHQASGSLLLFADVDTRFRSRSISQLIDYMTRESAGMISVLPLRENSMRGSAIFATLRHFWNLLAHDQHQPSVASSAWMIKRSLLEKLGGFEAVATEVRPEKSLAAQVARNDVYRFIISTIELGVTYEKKLSSQYETAIRIYYPDFGFGGILLRVGALLLALVPYVVVIVSIFSNNVPLFIASFPVTILYSVVNAWYLGVLRSNGYGMATTWLPVILAREIYLLLASFVLYKHGRVTWKGRPVTTAR